MTLNKLVIALAATGFASGAYATNGMNLEGYGPVAAGMGGASMAYDNGTAAVMNNPATLSLASEGSRLDVAVGMLGPDVTASFGGGSTKSGGDAYYMPAVGYIKTVGNKSYGVALFAQGGMGTEYPAGSVLDPSMGSLTQRSELGVGRLIFPLSMKMDDKLTVGGSADVVWAMMDLQMAMSGAQFGDMVAPLGGTQTYGTASGTMVDGLVGAIGGFDSNPMTPGDAIVSGVDWAYFNFTDSNDYTGKTRALGLAGKLGFTYKVSPKFTIGGTYHSKTALGDMKGDATLSMQVDTGPNGNFMFGPGMDNQANVPVGVAGKIKIVDFQWPETFGLGMAYQVNDRLMVAADYKRIGWQDVMKDFKMTFTADNVATNGPFAGAVLDAKLYQDWDDQNVFLLGMAYKATEALTLRVGANISDNPIPDSYMNPLFPAIVKNHYTVGFGYAINQASDVNFSLQHAPEVSQTSSAGVKADHAQTSWQLMYSRKF